MNSIYKLVVSNYIGVQAAAAVLGFITGASLMMLTHTHGVIECMERVCEQPDGAPAILMFGPTIVFVFITRIFIRFAFKEIEAELIKNNDTEGLHELYLNVWVPPYND